MIQWDLVKYPSDRISCTNNLASPTHGKFRVALDMVRKKHSPPLRKTHTQTHTHTHTRTRTHARTHASTHARTHTHTQTRTHAHIDTHARTHARTHTHTHFLENAYFDSGGLQISKNHQNLGEEKFHHYQAFSLRKQYTYEFSPTELYEYPSN